MLKLVIANQNYSSWSLRAWLLLTEAGIPFETVKLYLDSPAFDASIGRYSPARRVPVLLDGDFAVWDTLAIAEYAAERFPERGIWPADVQDRARARSICAEMHSGFGSLRSSMPMNISASLPGCGWSVAVQKDIDRLIGIWREALARRGGPMLFGTFSAADAFFAPVMSRFATYGVALPDDIATYRDAVLALPGMRQWTEAALAETEFVVADEPYRTRP